MATATETVARPDDADSALQSLWFRIAALLVFFATVPLMTEIVAADNATAEKVAFADIPGWNGDNHLAALQAFERSCSGPHPSVSETALSFAEETRDAPLPRRDVSLEPVCSALAQSGGSGKYDRAAARVFFESWFKPFRITTKVGSEGHVTAYYEPVLDGALKRDEKHTVPLFARPGDLVPITDENRPGGFPAGLAACRQTREGIIPYPDRAELSDPESWAGLEPVAWLADPVDAYFVHIQGSVRLHMADGGSLRLGFAGKNGYPYRSAGKAMIERGLVPAAGMTSEAMKAWLKANPNLAADILNVNPSYVFFRRIEGLADDLGPIGAEGVPLTPKRSLAVDPRHIGYGMPVFVSAELPTGSAMAAEPFHQLMIAQDTGSAIRGPARGDLFWGSGDSAGEVAGRINNAADFFVLKPRPAPAQN